MPRSPSRNGGPETFFPGETTPRVKLRGVLATQENLRPCHPRLRCGRKRCGLIALGVLIAIEAAIGAARAQTRCSGRNAPSRLAPIGFVAPLPEPDKPVSRHPALRARLFELICVGGKPTSGDQGCGDAGPLSGDGDGFRRRQSERYAVSLSSAAAHGFRLHGTVQIYLTRPGQGQGPVHRRPVLVELHKTIRTVTKTTDPGI